MLLKEKPIPVKKNILTSLILSILLFFFWRMDFLFANILHGFIPWIKNFIIVVLFFCVSTKAFIELYTILLNIRKLRIKLIIPFLILFLGLGWTLSNPFKIKYELLKGEVLLRACYVDEDHEIRLKLRKNHKFELHSKGKFFYEEYFLGGYTLHNDSLILIYNRRDPELISDKLILDKENQLLYPINHGQENILKEPLSLVNCDIDMERDLIIK